MKRIAKRLLILVSILAALSMVGVGIRFELREKAQKKRDAAYALTLQSYAQVLKPGMTRKQVEDYLQGKNIEFRQMCCVDPSELANPSSWDDLAKIGEEEAPWVCSEKNIYVPFQFADHNRRDGGMFKADDLDTLRAVSIYRWLEGCL